MTTPTETPLPETSDAWTLPELIASQLRSMHVIDGRLVDLAATPGNNHVALDISHPFPPKSLVRVVLYLSEPTSFDPDSGNVDATATDSRAVDTAHHTIAAHAHVTDHRPTVEAGVAVTSVTSLSHDHAPRHGTGAESGPES